MSENAAQTQEVQQDGDLSRIVKRDGTQVVFDSDKILSAIRRAGEATGEFDEDEASLLTTQVLKVLKHRFSATKMPEIE